MGGNVQCVGLPSTEIHLTGERNSRVEKSRGGPAALSALSLTLTGWAASSARRKYTTLALRASVEPGRPRGGRWRQPRPSTLVVSHARSGRQRLCASVA